MLIVLLFKGFIECAYPIPTSIINRNDRRCTGKYAITYCIIKIDSGPVSTGFASIFFFFSISCLSMFKFIRRNDFLSIRISSKITEPYNKILVRKYQLTRLQVNFDYTQSINIRYIVEYVRSTTTY
jgi:hypothetical protein